MHKLYEKVWKQANNISDKLPFVNRSWFLLINTCVWAIIGLVASYTLIILVSIAGFNVEKIVWSLIGTGYIAMVMGFGGGIMYIFRNTTPKDIK